MRRECSFALRFERELTDNGYDDNDMAFSGSNERLGLSLPAESPAYEAVHNAMKDLSEVERSLMEALFWNGLTEDEASLAMGIGRRALNKRKHAVFASLRNPLRKLSRTQASS